MLGLIAGYSAGHKNRVEANGAWFCSEMQAVLNRQLRPQYHVRVEERVYISDENDPGRKAIIPDAEKGVRNQ